MLSRWPVRIRLAAGFSAGLALVLVLAGAFVYIQVRDDLDHALDASLSARADDIRTLVEGSGAGSIDLGGVRAGEEESSFTEILDADGRAVESTLPDPIGVLAASQTARVGPDPTRINGLDVTGLEGEARAIALRVQGSKGPLVVVVGVTTTERDEALSGIRRAFALGGPMALLLASAIGYLLGARALTPVETMRLRAREITLDQAGERLPTPVADDELRSLSETLNEMLDRVETALERERVFVADASHELRTPLAILKAEIALIKRTGGSKETLEAALDSAGEEVDQLVLLAEDLLVIARAEQGQLGLRREPVGVGELLRRVGSRFERRAEERARVLTVTTADIGVRRIDRMRVEQALSNLVDNALRHGAGPIELHGETTADGVALSVSDGGPGFDQEFKLEAFERFTQADEGRRNAGAGLGLAIVAAIAGAHGGEAKIAEGTDGRTVVELRLVAPVAADAGLPG